MALTPGTRLGPYEILSPIGAGGMGEVYRARDSKLGREVAIKVLPDEFTEHPEKLARFEREAKLLAALNHPKIATLHGLEEAAGKPFLVMGLVEGETLADRIARGPLPTDEALGIALQIAEGLEAAHEKGVIHRDLKPANIKVDAEGNVKVLDFGLAKAFADDEGGEGELSQSPTLSRDATRAGVILGTAAYMSPEQAKGKTLDKRTDIFSFGVVLYEMLTGARAFTGEDVSDTLAAVLRAEPVWEALPSGLSPSLRTYLTRCLEKNPKRRVRDIGDVRLAIEGAFDTDAAAPVEKTAASAPRPWQRPIPLALAILASCIVGGLIVWMLTPAPERPLGRFVVSTAPTAPFTGEHPVHHELAISPDGTHIAYVTGRDPAFQLYVRSVEEIEGRIGLGGMNNTTPFFSPDGAWLGFFSRADGNWKKVSVLGGPPITLWNSPGGPRGASWGPDGTIVIGALGAGLFRGSDGGGELEMLTAPDETRGELDHLWPEFLPGGRAILFTIVSGNSDQDRQIAVLDLETRSYEVLIPGGSQPRYAPTGHIVYGTEGTLRAVAFDVATLAVTGNPVPVAEDVMMKRSGSVNFGLSSTGSLVVASASGFGRDQVSLVWVDREGNEAPVALEPGIYREFSLSRDDTRVAIMREEPDGNDVWIYDLTRDTFTRLTFGPSAALPTWTPDGARVAFGSAGGAQPMAWKAADGTGDVEVLGEGKLGFPQAFTPDGNSLVFVQLGGAARDVGLLRLDGERPSTMLLDSNADEENAALSPDGRWLAYSSTESGRSEVYVRPFPEVNTGRWQISTDGGDEPLWSPRGDELFFRGPSGVMALAYDGDPTFTPGTLNRLFAWEFVFAGRDRRMAVSQDGDRFLMLKHASTRTDEDTPGPQIILTLNWLEELKRLVPTQ